MVLMHKPTHTQLDNRLGTVKNSFLYVMMKNISSGSEGGQKTL